MRFLPKKAIAGIITLCLIFAAAIPADTAKSATSAKKTYSDVSGHTYEKALLYVIENGLMENSGSNFSPNSKLTKGSACFSLNNLLGATAEYDRMNEVTNLAKGDEYYEIVSVGLNCGYLVHKDDGKVYSPRAYATYGYVADIFSSVLGMDMKANIIGNNKASDVLTRGEYADLLHQLAPNIVSKSTRNDEFTGDVYITKANLLLANVTIEGNLIITDAVGDQNVTLNNVEVTGKVIVRGGGENSVILHGITTIAEMILKQVNHKVSVKVNGNSFIKLLDIAKGSHNVDLRGKIEGVKVSANDVKVSLTDATIESVNISGTGSDLAVSSKSVIENVKIEESASGTSLDVAGTVGELSVAAKNSEITVSEGTVTSVKADKTAENLSIEVSDNAVIETVVSEADNTAISGTGTVTDATVTGEGSEVATKDTNTSTVVTPAPTNPTTPTTPGGTGGGGGGGGGSTVTTDYRAIFDSQLKNSMNNEFSSYFTTIIANGTITLTVNENNKGTKISSLSEAAVTEALKYVTGSNSKYKVTNVSVDGANTPLDKENIISYVKGIVDRDDTLENLKGLERSVTLTFIANGATYSKTYTITVN